MKVVDYPIGELDFLLWRLQASLKVVDTARSLLLERPSNDETSRQYRSSNSP